MKTQPCTKHPDREAIHVHLATNDVLCVSCALEFRRAGSRDVRKLSVIEAPMGPGRHAAKVCFQVVAGLAPGLDPLAEFTEEWWITSEQWEALGNNPEMTPDHPDNLFTRYQAEAHWYAQHITDPRLVNWVRVDFIYF